MLNLLNSLMCFAPKVPKTPAAAPVPDPPSPTAELTIPSPEEGDTKAASRKRSGKQGLRLNRGSGLNV